MVFRHCCYCHIVNRKKTQFFPFKFKFKCVAWEQIHFFYLGHVIEVVWIVYLQIGFEQTVIPSEIKLYETYHAGGVSKIMAKNPAGHWVALYTAPRLENIKSSRIFSPNLTVKWPYMIQIPNGPWNHALKITNKKIHGNKKFCLYNCGEID